MTSLGLYLAPPDNAVVVSMDEILDPGTDLPVVRDTYGTHKHPEVSAWLENNRS